MPDSNSISSLAGLLKSGRIIRKHTSGVSKRSMVASMGITDSGARPLHIRVCPRCAATSWRIRDQRSTPSVIPFEPPASDNRPSVAAGVSRIALICGFVAWFGEGLILLAEMGSVPRAVKLGGATLLVSAICWLIAVFGGFLGGVVWRNRAGCIALIMSLLLPFAVIGLVMFVGSGWLD